MKNIVLAIVIVAAAAFGFTYLKKSKEAASAANEALNSRETTAKVETKDINFVVTVSGEITPEKQVSVRPEVNGLILELPVDIGDKVKKDQLLFALDDKNIRIEIEQRQTQIDAANLQLEKARRNFERDRKLYQENLVSKEAFENTETEFSLAKNNIERAQKDLDLAMERLDKTQILAPFDCTILTRPVSAGQAVSGSGGFNSGTEVLTIADLNRMIINAHVNQADVSRLSVGLKVDIQVEAIAGLVVEGTVERIAPQATIVNGIKGFSARILLNKIDPRIQPGMTANIKIPVQSAAGVTAVPLGAVFTEYNEQLKKQERFVYVQNGNTFERRVVQIGVADYFFAEILSGLNSGETVSLEQPPLESIVESGNAPGNLASNPS
ncbi:MAG: efflux RND transporter periplasmic adaptor subunit [Verrucomicrobia bacterium]|jgi:HlyD family secretion protein|nr:efflux RND transporter periplasmic adaptor subunit [Verrucomicrobiota bacterium]